MIARIRTSTGFYDSAVFAIYYHAKYYEVLVFDKKGNKLKLQRSDVSCSDKILICVFIYDIRTENWTKTPQAEGYDWILGHEITYDVLERCKNIQSQIPSPEWFEIKDQADADGLLRAATYFHYAYVKDIFYIGERLCILFKAWSCEVLFSLEGNATTNLVKGFGNIRIDDAFPFIYDSAVFLEDGKIYWTDNEETDSFEEIEQEVRYYFSAEKVKWKLRLTDDYQ